jgi:uncharacterized protein YjbI with pentapeptide repeats
LLVVLACVLVIPEWLVRWELGAPVDKLPPAEKAKAINDIRTTLLQGIGGAVLVLGAYFTYRQLQTSREAQITERFTRAIDQLGRAELDVRLGGIYALERIARDSPADCPVIGEVITAYLRSHASWLLPNRPGQPAEDENNESLDLQLRAPDVHAALMVLGRGRFAQAARLDLRAVDLRWLNLDGADLHRAILDGAYLQGAQLRHVDLHGASFDGADLAFVGLEDCNLAGAIFTHANLEAASLKDANLEGAVLSFSGLGHASFRGGKLQGADLSGAELQGVDLREANLQGADLSGADLHEADLQGAELSGANLDDAQLGNAQADRETIWPAGFDLGRAGVVLVNRRADIADESGR